MSLKQIPGIDSQYSESILKLFLSAPKGTEIILFGSRAKGNFREGSDIDLAIKGKANLLEQRDQWLLEYDNLNLPWKLDLIVYSSIQEPALVSHIDRVGISLLKT